jgi:ArsR family transcriptional regulator, arsenate/arsenite/antimonite-responsive transcriptional repressor
MDTDALSRRLAALGNPTRLAAFRLLVRAGRGGLPVGVLAGRLDLPPSTLSHHLAQLLREGLVTQDRQGTTLICRADFAELAGVTAALQAECCAEEAPPE